MLRWLLLRLCWMTATLLGVTFVTFLVFDAAPVDRAQLEVARRQQDGSLGDLTARERAIVRLRVLYGQIDGKTFEPLPVWQRYANWLGRASKLQLAQAGEDDAALWRRLGDALPKSLLVGGLGLLVALLVGVPLGSWLGMHVGTRRDRWLSQLLFVVGGVPEFLLGTLLLLVFSGAWLGWLPSSGFHSRGAEHWDWLPRLLDHAWHLVLPVSVMASGPALLITRFVRDAVARAAAAPFARNLQALGTPEDVVRRRLLHHGALPLATLAGGLLPMLVAGSIVIENLFTLDGLGHLAFRSVSDQDQAMVMALVLLMSVVTLAALAISDLLYRLVDPRVRLHS